MAKQALIEETDDRLLGACSVVRSIALELEFESECNGGRVIPHNRDAWQSLRTTATECQQLLSDLLSRLDSDM